MTWDARDSSPPSEKIETAKLLVQQLKRLDSTQERTEDRTEEPANDLAPEPEPCGCEESVWLRAELARVQTLANRHAVEALEGREREGRLSRLLAKRSGATRHLEPEEP